MSGIAFEDSMTHATDVSASFYTHFQAVKNGTADISARLEALDAASRSKNDSNKEKLNKISSEIVKLRKDLVDATPYLPTYDRGKCEEQLKALEESLSRHRTPKSKFTFKRKPATIPAVTPLTPSKPLPTHISPFLTSENAPSTTNLTLTSHTSALLTLSSLGLPGQASSCNNSIAPSEIQRSSDVTLREIRNCIVNLFPSPSNASGEGRSALKITALHAKLLHRVVLIVPPIEGSVLLHDVRDSIVVVGCHQFRMHDSENTTVLLHVQSNPVVEGSSSIQFGSYPEGLRNASTKSFFESPSKHTLVQDFDWIKPSPSPNWSILSSSMDTNSDPRVDSILGMMDNRLGDEDVEQMLESVIPRG